MTKVHFSSVPAIIWERTMSATFCSERSRSARCSRRSSGTRRRLWSARRPAPLYLLSRLVRENGYKVVLTGEGADEVLGGYDIFKEAKIRRFWAAAQRNSAGGRCCCSDSTPT